jgi:alpha-glucosidase
MQWSPAANAGFTAGRPWLPLAVDYSSINVECEATDSKSMLTLYRRLITLRRQTPALSIGRYLAVPEAADLLSYRRQFDNRSDLLIILNVSAQPTVFQNASVPQRGTVALSTHLDRDAEPFAGRIALRADEGVVIELARG